MSCHSCHPDGHTNGLLNDNLGDGNFGAPKRVLSLLGVGQTGPWAWNGGVADLGVRHPHVEFGARVGQLFGGIGRQFFRIGLRHRFDDGIGADAGRGRARQHDSEQT